MRPRYSGSNGGKGWPVDDWGEFKSVVMQNGPRYRVELQPLRSDVPVDVRLRHLLKLALRACQLRAVSVREIRPAAEPKTEKAKLQ
jgi:hypothetical protein